MHERLMKTDISTFRAYFPTRLQEINLASVTCSWRAEFSICLTDPPLSDVRTPQNKLKPSVTDFCKARYIWLRQIGHLYCLQGKKDVNATSVASTSMQVPLDGHWPTSQWCNNLSLSQGCDEQKPNCPGLWVFGWIFAHKNPRWLFAILCFFFAL